jgi:hypothetical protein
MNRRCCYSNSIGGFLGANRDEWLQEMRSAFSNEYRLALGDSQEHAWVDCFDTLQDQLSSLDPAYSIIFEYALPYESGRRPDVILLSKEQVLILEFKMKPTALPEDVDQAGAYARDIREYHFESRDKDVKAVLVLTRAKGIHPTNNAGVTVVPVIAWRRRSRQSRQQRLLLVICLHGWIPSMSRFRRSSRLLGCL